MQTRARDVWLAGLLVVAAPAWAQGPAAGADPAAEMPTDRPGFNASASVVGAGVVQLELGWSTVGERHGGHASVGPQPQLRFGLSPQLELQVASAGLGAACVANCAWHGMDVGVGGRWLVPAQPLGFDLAATGAVSVPTGSARYSSQHLDPLLVVHAGRGLGEYLELSYNYLVTRIHDDDELRASVRHGHGVSLGVSTGRWSPFVALARRPEHVDGAAPWLAQAGTGFRLARDVKVDVTVDGGLNTAEPTWRLSAGLVLRHRPR